MSQPLSFSPCHHLQVGWELLEARSVIFSPKLTTLTSSVSVRIAGPLSAISVDHRWVSYLALVGVSVDPSPHESPVDQLGVAEYLIYFLSSTLSVGPQLNPLR